MNEFHDLADLSAEQINELLTLAGRLQKKPEPRALEGKILAHDVVDACREGDGVEHEPFTALVHLLGDRHLRVSPNLDGRFPALAVRLDAEGVRPW